MELNQIRYFLAVARELHFTRAAAACNVSQPALSKAIQRLEEEFGGPLFFRERGDTQLSELGRLMLPTLERALAAASEAKQQAEAFNRRVISPLRIGIEWSVPIPLLRPALSTIFRRCPDLELSLHQAGQAGICARLIAGELDTAVLVQAEALHERLHRWPLFAENYLLACPEHHPFREREQVSVRDLEHECLLLLQHEDCPARRTALTLLEQNGVRPKRTHFVDNQEQIVELLLASLGVYVAGDQMMLPASVIRRPIVPDPGPRTIVIAAVAGRPLGPTPGMFLKLMRARAWPAMASAA